MRFNRLIARRARHRLVRVRLVGLGAQLGRRQIGQEHCRHHAHLWSKAGEERFDSKRSHGLEWQVPVEASVPAE